MKTDYLNINEMTRTGEKIKKVENIILHSIGNVNTTLKMCKKEIDNLSNEGNVYFSLHYIIDKEGNILNCIPEEEISLSCRKIDTNYYAISIGCIPCDESGKFSKKTIDSLVTLTSSLCKKYNLEKKNILRHYDITLKRCPMYYVDNCVMFEEIKRKIKLT